MSTPALYNIKTVTGLQDCLVLQVIDSLGNVISGNNYVVRGAIALKGETYNLTVTQDALGDYLLTWENLPAGVWRYDIFVNEEPLLYGNAIVQGRVTPCVTENTQDLGQFLQVQTDQEGVVKITLSDVNSAKWYAEVAKGSADEAKNVLQETENLSLDIERQIEAGKTEISETTASSISSINTAENSAIANIDTEKENALDDLSQEVTKAQNYATSAQNSATQSATSATNAQESETKAKDAQTETETLANELDEKYERAVFADNSGNVDIEGGLTVDGTANLNGGAIVPEPTTNENPQTYGLARSHEAVVRPAIQAWFNTQTDLRNLYKGNKDILSFGYDLPELLLAQQMFHSSGLRGLNFSFPKLTNGNAMFYECIDLQGAIELVLLSLNIGSLMFYQTGISSFTATLPNCTKLDSAFRYCKNLIIITLNGSTMLSNINTMCDGCSSLVSFTGDLSSVTSAEYAFRETKLSTFNSDMSNVKIGTACFAGFVSTGGYLVEFNSPLHSLENGFWFFARQRKLTTCRYLVNDEWSYLTLPKLYNGVNMFNECQLDKPTAVSVLNSLQQKDTTISSSSSSWQLTIGIHVDHENDEEVLQAIANAEAKGWTITVQWNGTSSL